MSDHEIDVSPDDVAHFARIAAAIEEIDVDRRGRDLGRPRSEVHGEGVATERGVAHLKPPAARVATGITPCVRAGVGAHSAVRTCSRRWKVRPCRRNRVHGRAAGTRVDAAVLDRRCRDEPPVPTPPCRVFRLYRSCRPNHPARTRAARVIAVGSTVLPRAERRCVSTLRKPSFRATTTNPSTCAADSSVDLHQDRSHTIITSVSPHTRSSALTWPRQ